MKRFRHTASKGLGRGQRVNDSRKKQLQDSQNLLVPCRVSDTLEALVLLPVPDFTSIILQASQQWYFILYSKASRQCRHVTTVLLQMFLINTQWNQQCPVHIHYCVITARSGKGKFQLAHHAAMVLITFWKWEFVTSVCGRQGSVIIPLIKQSRWAGTEPFQRNTNQIKTRKAPNFYNPLRIN
jgi:hypothetical protein